jgi:hypothetical protein
MRRNSARAELTTSGIRNFECRVVVHEGTHHHEHRTRFARGFGVQIIKFQLGRAANLQRIAVRPFNLYTDALKDFDNTVHLLDAGKVGEAGYAVVEQAATQQPHGGIFAGFERNFALQLMAAFDTEINGTASKADELFVQYIANTS